MISGNARLAGVAGWPIAHSRSQRLHNFWLRRYEIDGVYVPLAIRPDSFEVAVRALPKLGFSGCNVTLPHKEAALRVCDWVDPAARRIGAVNTIVVTEDGSLEGSCTDGFGFLQALNEGAPELELSGARTLLIGAGGSAKAIAVSLLDSGLSELIIVNRTRARAEKLSIMLDGEVRVADWDLRSEQLDAIDLLVNTTNLGMQGQPQLELELDALPQNSVVMDAVYTPVLTPLLAAAQRRGNRIVDGLGMLLHQARPGFAAWVGRQPVVDQEVSDHVLLSL